MANPPELVVEHTVVIQAPPARVLDAFFNAEDLKNWWQVIRSVTVPRPMGTFSVEWASTEYRDDLLGPLGGAFHGTVIDYRSGSEFFVGDAYWQPPEGEAIGPMALEVRCTTQDSAQMTRLTVRQSGDDDSPRWQRYFDVVSAGWRRALADLQAYLDGESSRERR
jgi:uncharacterized protein YndB with AHSA1/START domain